MKNPIDRRERPHGDFKARFRLPIGFLHDEQISIMCVADNRGRWSEIEVLSIPLRSLIAATPQCQDNEVVCRESDSGIPAEQEQQSSQSV